MQFDVADLEYRMQLRKMASTRGSDVGTTNNLNASRGLDLQDYWSADSIGHFSGNR